MGSGNTRRYERAMEGRSGKVHIEAHGGDTPKGLQGYNHLETKHQGETLVQKGKVDSVRGAEIALTGREKEQGTKGSRSLQ